MLLAAMFMTLLDTTVVNVALPTMQATLKASVSSLSWVIAGYALALGLALIPAGRLGDQIGHKPVFITGVAVFTTASAACGLAQSDVQLVLFRLLQGLGGGLFTPAVTAFIQLMFPGPVRGKAFAVMGGVIGVSSAVGPVLGGAIIQAFGATDGWRLVFWLNVPIGIAALVGAGLLLPPGRPTQHAGRPRLDMLGLILLTGGLVALLVPLIQGQEAGWPAWTLLTLAVAAALLVGFGLWEVGYKRRGGTPLVPPLLFRHPAFTGGIALATVYFAAFTSIFFVMSILWQTGLGHTALDAGLVLLPFAIGSTLASLVSDQLSQRLGRTVLALGALLVTLGLGWTWLIVRTVTPTALSSWTFLVPLLIAGLGNGAFIAPNTQFIIATVDRPEAGAASGVVATAQRIGSAIGIAVVGSVLFGQLATTQTDAPNRYIHATTTALAVSTALSLTAFLLVFVLPKHEQPTV